MNEIWKDIVGYEGLYQVSNLGRVKSLIYSKILKEFNDGRCDGYSKIKLYKDKSNKTIKISRLVAIAFLPNYNNLPVVNHIDGNKQNNSVNNLEWVTHSENQKHAIRTGLLVRKTGENNKRSKFSDIECYNIRKIYEHGNISYSKLANVYKCSIPYIWQIVKGEGRFKCKK